MKRPLLQRPPPIVPANNNMQRTALHAADDAERLAPVGWLPFKPTPALARRRDGGGRSEIATSRWRLLAMTAEMRVAAPNRGEKGAPKPART